MARPYIVTDTRTSVCPISTMVTRKTHDAFQEMAEAEGLSKSAKTRQLIERFVQEQQVATGQQEYHEGLRAVRERVANGGKPWSPK